MTTADVETIGLLKTEEIRIRRERLDSTNDCAIMNEWTESEKNEEKWEKPRRKLGEGKYYTRTGLPSRLLKES